MQQLAQATVDVLTWFLVPFSACIAISWVVSLFRYK